MIIVVATIGHFACRGPSAPVPLPVELELVQTGIAHVDLNLTMGEGATGIAHKYMLSQNGAHGAPQVIAGTDTLIRVTNLKPDTHYSFRAYSLYEVDLIDSSQIVTTTTGDTTSRVYAWEVDSIGSYVSILWDVAVITDDDIWAVGRIGGWGTIPEELQYNALHWNGQEWELVWIKYLHLSTTQSDGPYGLESVTAVHAISSNAVWAAGGTPYFYDGETWTSYQNENSSWGLQTREIRDIWAHNANDVYFVGDEGYAYHWDGTDFTRIDLGTNMDLVNVSGSDDRVYVVGKKRGYSDSVVFENVEGRWSTLLESNEREENPEMGQWGGINSVKVLMDTAYFGTSSGILKYAYKSEIFDLVPDATIGIPYYSIEEVAVLAPNDIHLFNYDERYYHFNGLTWKRYDDHIDLGFHYKGADFNENTAVMIGDISWVGAVLIRGTR